MVSGSVGETHVLPTILPVFVIPGAMVLPHGRIPLVVFEPRYLALVDDALGHGRLFGLIQTDPHHGGTVPDLQRIGTLARIIAFGETGDGRYLITIQGVSRFHVQGERTGTKGYRRLDVGYDGYATDLDQPTVTLPDRQTLIELVQAQLGSMDMAGDWEALSSLSDDQLIDRLAMACPFNADERQALLEAPDHHTRCALMIAMLQRELISDSGPATIH